MTIEEVRQHIDERIYDNENGEITGSILNRILHEMLSAATTGTYPPSSGNLNSLISDIVIEYDASTERNIMTIYLTDGREFSLFEGRDGRDGEDGEDGNQGTPGLNGEDGVGISDIIIEDVEPDEGNPGGKRITIVLTNGRQFPFFIENGQEGPMGPIGSGNTEFEDEWREFQEEFDRYKSQVSGDIESIRTELQDTVAQNIGDAMNDIHQAQEDLIELRDRLSEAARTAQDALDAARALSGISVSSLTQEQLQEILAINDRVDEWLNTFSGKISSILAEYDDVLGNLGEIGIGADPSKGLLAIIAENISLLSGTVGTVQTEWDASKGSITDVATWYAESAGTYSELISRIDAMNATITDIVSYMSSGNTSQLTSYIDGKLAEMGRQIVASAGAITTINERLNGLSGIVSTTITRYDLMSGSLVTITDEMNAMDGKITQALTKADSALTEAVDLREVWDVNEGIIRTVANLVISVDGNGDPIYYYIDPDLADPSDRSQWVRVYYMGIDPDTNLPYYNSNKDGSGTRYDENVFPDYITGIFSYIQQASSAINLTVTSGDIISALRLEVSEDGSLIYMTADKVMIDADVIAQALTAKTANIGGVHIGNGMIYAGSGSSYWALDGRGNLYANNAALRGSISADSGYFRGDIYADNGYFKGSVSADSGYFRGDVYANDGYFKGVVSADSGCFNGEITATTLTLGGKAVSEWPDSEGLTEEEVNDLIARAAAESGWTAIDMGDYYLVGTSVGPDSAFTVTKDGLLIAKNAIISGTVVATDGIFNGTVYAKDGSFKGAVSANTGYFENITATNMTIENSRFTGDITANSLTLGNTEYENLDDFATKVDLEEWKNQLGNISALTAADIERIQGLLESAGTTTVRKVDNESGGSRYYVSVNGETIYWDTWDTGDYVIFNTPYSGGEYSFYLEKNGLLQAKNAVIWGTIYASDGWFRGRLESEEGYFRGTVCADTGYFKGDVEARSLKLGNQTIQDYVTDRLSGYSTTSGLSMEQVNTAISTFLNDNHYNSGITLSGYVTSAMLNTWVDQWNAEHSGNTLTEAEVSAIAKTVLNAEVSFVEPVANSAGGYTYIAHIGDRTYEWNTLDAGDFLVLGNWLGDSATTGDGGFIVSKDGLLQANNAVIYGAVYASEGKFKGSVSADSGYFKGDIEARSLKLGTSASDTIKGLISANSVTSATVKSYVEARNEAVSGAIMSWANKQGWITSAETQAMIAANSGAEMSIVTSTTANGVRTYTANIGGTEYTWNTLDGDDYIILDVKQGTGDASHSGTNGFIVNKNGLMEAYNAVVYGTVYASAGRFKGDITADSLALGEGVDKGSLGFVEIDHTYGKLTGTTGSGVSISTSGLLRAKNAIISGTVYANDGVFKGTVYADAGEFKGKIESNDAKVKGVICATTLYLGDTPVTEIPNTSGMVKVNTTIGGVNSSVTISSDGLLVAKNAIISGSVYATNGVFNGDIHANNGYFNGTVSATNMTFNGAIQMPYEEAAGSTFSPGDTTGYIFAPTNFTGTIVLPNPAGVPNGRVYDIVVEPYVTMAHPVGLSVQGGGYIRCYAFWESFLSQSYTLHGGRFTVVKIGGMWALVTATGEIADSNGNHFAPLFSANYNGSTMINKVVTFTDSRPADGAFSTYQQTLFIQEPITLNP